MYYAIDLSEMQIKMWLIVFVPMWLSIHTVFFVLSVAAIPVVPRGPNCMLTPWRDPLGRSTVSPLIGRLGRGDTEGRGQSAPFWPHLQAGHIWASLGPGKTPMDVFFLIKFLLILFSGHYHLISWILVPFHSSRLILGWSSAPTLKFLPCLSPILEMLMLQGGMSSELFFFFICMAE